MILIPEQVKALREEIARLEEKIRDYQEYFKDCEKSSAILGFVNYTDNTLEVNNYNSDKKKLEIYKRALVENEFIDSKNSNTIECGTEFTVLFDDTKEEETYTLVENTIGLARERFSKDKGYIVPDSSLGKAVIGKSIDDEFSYDINIKGKKGSISITGKIIDIIKKSRNDINFIISKKKSKRIYKKWKKDISKLNDLKEITLSQYELLKEEKERLLTLISKLEKYNNKIRVGSIITLENKKGITKDYEIVDKDEFDITKEIDVNTVLGRKIISKRKNDEVDEAYSYQKNGIHKKRKYKGKIINIDNSNVEQEDKIYTSIYSLYNRLNTVNKLLSNCKIVTPQLNNTVGIGSKVSIITYENGEIQNRRVELINQAVSTELNTDYVEAISSLGESIIGLKDNDSFGYYYYSDRYRRMSFGNGAVYDINNNMNERLAKDPLTYIKKRRG